MQDLHRFTWAKKRFTLLVDFTKGKHFGGWRQPWGSDFTWELVSLRQSPPRFREWHPDKRLEVPRLAMRSCMGWILLMVAEVKMSLELELICWTCSVFHQGAKAIRFYIYIYHHRFIIIFHHDFCNLTCSAWDARTRKCWPLVFFSGFKRWKSIIYNDFAGFSGCAVSTAGRGMSWSWCIIKKQVFDESDMRKIEKTQDEGWMKSTRTVALQCWPFQCSERKLRASADPNLARKNADLWMLSMMDNVIIDYDHCSQLRDMVGPRDKLTR